MDKPAVGTIGWVDLTVDDAESLRDFYASVVGWTPAPVDMGDYNDFNMLHSAGEPAAGICHQRGSNVGIPQQWMMYVTVADLDESMAACERGGGSVVYGPRTMGSMGRFCAIRDPAGAVAGLFEYTD